MDAQNAIESTTARPPAPERRTDDNPNHNNKKSPLDLPSSPPIKTSAGGNDDDANSDAETVVLPGKDGYSPSKTRKVVNRGSDRKDSQNNNGDTSTTAARREAPPHGLHPRPHGKDRERERDGDRPSHAPSRERGRDPERGPVNRLGLGGVSAEAASSLVAKKKRPALQQRATPKDGSSGLSSAPASPPPHPSRRRLAEHRSQADSDSDSTRARSPKSMSHIRERDRERERPRLGPAPNLGPRPEGSEKAQVPHKRKVPPTKAESDDEGGEARKARRPRLLSHATGSELSTPSKGLHPREPKSIARQDRQDRSGHSQHPPQNRDHPDNYSRTRSTSPNHKPPHRRSLSTHLPASHGLGQKKKRIPPPLNGPLSTGYPSDDSSAGGSPHPRGSKSQALTTPATADSTSPAKMAPHKKHLDAHGQTLLARACARGEYEMAKARLLERPDDLNVADYAGNTPLQIASLHGHEQIVKLLLDSGCQLDCVNNDRDTPLLDAVDNGHLEVISLLLEAGVNPRKTNLNGEEPLSRVSDDLDNAEAIRRVIRTAKNKPNAPWRRQSEEHHVPEQSPQEPHPPPRRHRESRSHGPESPPPELPHPSSVLGRRAATSRSNKTSNSQLYKPLDDKTLRQAACRGDEETVLRILQVKDGYDDPESMVGAARGGHETVMNYLLALGGCDPDPDPIGHLPDDQSTPILAAIGQGSLPIVRLLLSQSNFDPTRKFKGETYYEIARRRAGADCEEEEDLLKDAYDNYKKSHRGSLKGKSPNRRNTNKEPRPSRATTVSTESKEDVSRVHKRKASSPTREVSKSRVLSGKAGSPKENKRANSFTGHHEEPQSKRGPGRPRKEVPSIAVPGPDGSPQPTSKALATKIKRQEADAGAHSSDGEAEPAKPRRKLMSGQQLKDQRERDRVKQRRSSMVSNNSTKESSSPKAHDDSTDKPKPEHLSEKFQDRAKALRRDDSRDRLSASGEPSAKRHRSSVTPPRHGTVEKEEGEVPAKRRRLDAEGKEKRQRSTNSSPEDRHRKPPSLREGAPATKSSSLKGLDKEHGGDTPRPKKLMRAKSVVSEKPVKSAVSEKPVRIKSEDIDMPDAPAVRRDSPALKKDGPVAKKDVSAVRKDAPVVKKDGTAKKDIPVVKKEDDSDAKAKRIEEKRRRAKLEAVEARKREEEHKRVEEEKREREAEEVRKRELARKQEEEERKRKEEEHKRLKEEEARQLKEEEDRKRREEEKRAKQAAEIKKKEEEEKKRLEEEKRRREQEEQQRREAEERKRREEEEERIRQQEEARLRKEQLEREAAEAARRKQEAEERERREQAHREELERQRVALEAEQRRVREEQEQERLAKLPALLRWFDGCESPKTREVASRFTRMHGIRYDTIVPDAQGSGEVLRELWVLNTHVALLLGDKDLSLSRYSTWPRLAASHIAKTEVFHVESSVYALGAKPLWDLAKELPGYFGKLDGSRGLKMAKDIGDTFELFDAMDLFFVKTSDFMSAVSTMAHLRDVEITVQYKELPLNKEMHKRGQLPLRWKHDPALANLNHGAAPGATIYVNGERVGQTRTGNLYRISREPFDDGPVPRRGFTAVSRHDPEYEELCKEQGLAHLLSCRESEKGMTNGALHSASPTSTPSERPHHYHALTPVTPGPTEPTEADVMAGSMGTGSGESGSKPVVVNGTHGEMDVDADADADGEADADGDADADGELE